MYNCETQFCLIFRKYLYNRLPSKKGCHHLCMCVWGGKCARMYVHMSVHVCACVCVVNSYLSLTVRLRWHWSSRSRSTPFGWHEDSLAGSLGREGQVAEGWQGPEVTQIIWCTLAWRHWWDSQPFESSAIPVPTLQFKQKYRFFNIFHFLIADHF